MKNHIFQIYYSDATLDQVDPGFIPLDNTGQRPDWREYWPMRRFLIENTLDPNARYGFLSPKFMEKTGLTAVEAMAFVNSIPDDVDVVTFSPFFDQAAFFQSVFEHAALCHPGIGPVIEEAVRLTTPGLKTSEIVMSSVQTVFCNYLVAKPAFWLQWLEKCERIFEVAEAADSPLAQQLNDDVKYESQRAPAKVFIIERMASLLLATQPGWKVRNFNPTTLPMGHAVLSQFNDDLLTLDALKHMAKETGFPQYMGAYLRKRIQVIERLNAVTLAKAPA
ncbi:hypothetical protein [Paraburkholderia sp. J12]|uniref:hypothetical protein n=1 Tax=Paraburkholderia sp. J12 TaxID=2805432 RepID=UPI002ABE49C3|nr:hypothetical protein [Paraburkholderia sp. J12]